MNLGGEDGIRQASEPKQNLAVLELSVQPCIRFIYTFELLKQNSHVIVENSDLHTDPPIFLTVKVPVDPYLAGRILWDLLRKIFHSTPQWWAPADTKNHRQIIYIISQQWMINANPQVYVQHSGEIVRITLKKHP